MFRKFVIIGLCTSVFFTVSANAQEAVTDYDEATLEQLYVRYLENKDDSYVLKRIEDERAAIRNIIEEELQNIIAPAEDEQELDDADIPSAIERQQNIVAMLQERLQERRVDLEILNAEEERFYQNTVPETNLDQFRLTKSYPELLMRKAILEERITALELLLELQEDRLGKLQIEQRLTQFNSLINIGKYVLILLFVYFVERFIRTTILVRIGKRERRYTAIKLFTSTVYVLTALWLITVLFSKQPGILASFAIVGAGLAISLQDVVKDILGWFIIHQHRLYSKGDRINIGSHTGEVMDIGLLHTTLIEVGVPPESVLEHTGKGLRIPNALVLTQPLTNYHLTSDYMKAEMRITITFESDWRKAKSIVEQVLKEETQIHAEQELFQHRRRTRMFFTPYDPIGEPKVYMEIAADGVVLILRYTVPVGEQRPVMTKLTDAILERFNAEPSIELAYQTHRILAEMIRTEK